MILESLTHASPIVASGAVESLTKLCAVHKTSPNRVTVPLETRPLVDVACLGFFEVPLEVSTFDYDKKTPLQPSPTFSPTTGEKQEFAQALVSMLTPEVLNRIVQRRSFEAKSVVFTTTQARFWKSIFRILELRAVDWVRTTLTSLIDEGCTNNALSEESSSKPDSMNMCHRASLSGACEIMVGMFRAARHWERERAAVVEQLFASTLETIITRAPQESISDVVSALHFAVHRLDPRRYEAIQRVLLDRPFFSDPDAGVMHTAILKRRLQLADNLLALMSWRSRDKALSVLNYLLNNGMRHQYHQVRNVVAILVCTCIEIAWDPKIANPPPEVTKVFSGMLDSVFAVYGRHRSGEVIENPKDITAYWSTSFTVFLLALGRGSACAAGIMNCRAILKSIILYFSIERSELCDDEMTTIAQSTMHKLTHSHFQPEEGKLLLSDALELLKGECAQAKASTIALLSFVEGFVFANQQYLTFEEIDIALKAFSQHLADKLKAVRVRAVEALAFILRIYPKELVAEIANKYAASCKSPASRLEGVMGLRAIVTSFPDSVPPFVPPSLVTLGKHVGDRNSEISSAVKETFTAWWRAHNAAWQYGQKELFTEDQRDIVSELVYSSGYFV
jgi:hypothetical protein